VEFDPLKNNNLKNLYHSMAHVNTPSV